LSGGKLPNESSRVLAENIVTQFTTRIPDLPYHNTYAYGFGTACPGTKMINCFGHDGSTGVMAWGDKDKKIAFVVMNNRGHPDVKNNKIDALKPKIADAIMEALGY
jgi:CubicO group peptidase (beta-lactamase class C family)